MEAFIITLRDNPVSKAASKFCRGSSLDVGNDFPIFEFEATSKEKAEEQMSQIADWTYPLVGTQYHEKTDLQLSVYRTADIRCRKGCAMSHYRLWDMCDISDEPILVLEHDAKFVRKLDWKKILEETDDFNILGINNPLKATRKALLFHDMVLSDKKEYQGVPWIDNHKVPQGLAGNSAYIIKPEGARQMKALVEEHGFFPNDALMCKQLVSGLGVTRTFYTQVQGLRSTTTY